MDDMEFYREGFCEGKVWKVLKYLGIAITICIAIKVFVVVTNWTTVKANCVSIGDYDYELNEQDLAALKDESFFEGVYSEKADSTESYGKYYTVTYSFKIENYRYPEATFDFSDMSPEFQKILMAEGQTYWSSRYENWGDSVMWDDSYSKYFKVKKDYFGIKLHINSCDYSKEELEDILKDGKIKVTLTDRRSKKVKNISFKDADVESYNMEEEMKNVDYNWRADEWIFRTEHGKIERAKREGLPEGYYY